MSDKLGNSWTEWSRHVLYELERLNTCYESLRDEQRTFNLNVSERLAELKVKSGVWGVIGGMIPIIVIILIKMMGE